jgi:hypothetical protein
LQAGGIGVSDKVLKSSKPPRTPVQLSKAYQKIVKTQRPKKIKASVCAEAFFLAVLEQFHFEIALAA